MSAEPPVSLWPAPNALGTIADLYELTMMAGHLASGTADRPATFELFVRRLPENRAYLVFAGLEQAAGDVLRFAFSNEQIEALRRLPVFAEVPAPVFESLARLRFEGDVWAMPEGTIAFPGETLVRVTAPLVQAQWLETYLIAALSYPTLVASKAARVVGAARGRSLFEYGARRGHGPHAGFLAARAAYLAGFDGTSQTESARLLDVPAVGTMAHSWVQAFVDEPAAFAVFARVFGKSTTLLVDTYDTLQGTRHAAAIEPAVPAVRIDSGDLDELSRGARAILDELGRAQTKILVSGDLDEHRIAALVDAGAPIDGFGVGTELITSRDAPALGMVYKLVELDGQGRFKLSPGKKTYPMAKQVFRRRDAHGKFAGDHVTRADETAEGEPLLVPVIRSGRLAAPLPSLDAIRRHCRLQLEALPDRLRDLNARPDYPITYSDVLEADARRLMVG